MSVIIHNDGKRRVLELERPDSSSAGTVLDVSAGNLSPLFTTTIINPATHPSLSFDAISQGGNLFYASPDGGAGVPVFRSIVLADLPVLTTDNVSEGSRLYYTDARSRLAISLTTIGNGKSTYDNSTGILNIPPPKVFYMITTGQSNDQGGSIDMGGLDVTPDPRIQIWDHTAGAFVTAVCGSSPFDNPNSPTAGFFFAKKYLQENPNDTVRWVDRGQGGTPIEEWWDGSPQHLLNDVVTFAINAGFPRTDVLIWDQGEAGTTTGSNATYKLRQAQMFDYLRTKTFFSPTTKILVVDVSDLMKTSYYGTDETNSMHFLKVAADTDGDVWTGYVDTDGVATNDPQPSVHFSAAGLYELGTNRMWATFNSLPHSWNEETINERFWSTKGNYLQIGDGKILGSLTTAPFNFWHYNAHAGTLHQTRTSFGYNSLTSASVGSSITAFGSNVMINTTGNGNSAFGDSALLSLVSGASNSAFGYNALYNATGNQNVAFGMNAGVSLIDGDNNLFLGALSAANLFHGNYNTIVGNYYSPLNTSNNLVVIVDGQGKNALYRDTNYLTGIGQLFGNGTVVPTATLDVGINTYYGTMAGHILRLRDPNAQAGYVWTALDTDGNGTWAASGGGGGSITLTTTGTSGAATLVSGTLNIPNYTYTLPTASTSVLGGVKVDGSTITISGGVISAVGGGGGVDTTAWHKGGDAPASGTVSTLLGTTDSSQFEIIQNNTAVMRVNKLVNGLQFADTGGSYYASGQDTSFAGSVGFQGNAIFTTSAQSPKYYIGNTNCYIDTSGNDTRFISGLNVSGGLTVFTGAGSVISAKFLSNGYFSLYTTPATYSSGGYDVLVRNQTTGNVETTTISGGGSGTVTSVAATVTSSTALSIAGSPITASGTLAFTWTGSSSQYIKGDGTLATFPSIPSGTVTSFSFTNGNGFIGTVSNSTTTPTLSLTTNVTDKYIFYSNSNALAGSSNFTWDNSTSTLAITGNETITKSATNLTTGIAGLFDYTTHTFTGSAISTGSVYAAVNQFFEMNINANQTFNGGAVFTTNSNILRIGSTNVSAGTYAATQTGLTRAISANGTMIQFNTLSSSSVIVTVDKVAGVQIFAPQATDGSGIASNRLPLIDTYYAILIADSQEYANSGANITNKYGIYQTGTSDKNYFGGLAILNTANTYTSGGYDVLVRNQGNNNVEKISATSIAASEANHQIFVGTGSGHNSTANFTYNTSTDVFTALATVYHRTTRFEELFASITSASVSAIGTVSIDDFSTGIVHCCITAYDSTTFDYCAYVVIIPVKKLSGVLSIGTAISSGYGSGTLASGSVAFSGVNSSNNLAVSVASGTSHTVYWKVMYSYTPNDLLF